MSDRYESYLDLLGRWGKRIQLTAEPTNRVLLRERHIDDCAAIVPHLSEAGSVVDIGSGAGLPGIVLALCRPDLDVVLVEPRGRRVAFLRECRRKLDLERTVVFHGSDMDYLASDEFQLADVAVSRATFALDVWFDRADRLVRPGGLVIGMEGADRANIPGSDRVEYELAGRTRALLLRRAA